MAEQQQILSTFIENVKENQCLWGLQDADGEGWVVCDSAEFENTDVMPLWSQETLALTHCTEEWSDYQAVQIPLSEFLEFWVSDFNDDGVLVGINWQNNDNCQEIDPIELAKSLVDVEEE